MENLTKQEQISYFLKQYESFIREKNGIYIYPENIPLVLKEYLDKMNSATKAFPQWNGKDEDISEISEEELKKIWQDLDQEEDEDYKINFN